MRISPPGWRRLLAPALLVSSMLALHTVTAQTPATAGPGLSDSVPRDLALGILSLVGGGGTDLRVGVAPERFPLELIPPESEILGTAGVPSGSVVFVRMREEPRAAMEALEKAATLTGWTRPPAPTESRERGFASRRTYGPGMLSAGGSVFCRGAEMLAPTTIGRSARGGTVVRLQYQTQSQQWSPCTGPAEYRAPWADIPAPNLHSPLGAEMQTRATGGGPDEFRSEAHLRTTLDPGDIAADFAAQMREAGWELVAESSSALAAVQTWRFRDEKGSFLAVISTVALAGTSMRYADLRVIRQ